jgi:uncharacterized membrane protein YvlD (DUF360 family)
MSGLPVNLSYWLLQTFAMLVTALLIPKLRVDGPIPAFLTVLALAFVNAHIWDTALFFKVPDTLSSKALTLLLTNGAIFWIIVKVLPGIECEGILPALIAPIVFTFTSFIISEYGSTIDWSAVGKEALRLMLELKSYFEGASERGAGAPETGKNLSLLFGRP